MTNEKYPFPEMTTTPALIEKNKLANYFYDMSEDSKDAVVIIVSLVELWLSRKVNKEVKYPLFQLDEIFEETVKHYHFYRDYFKLYGFTMVIDEYMNEKYLTISWN